MTGSETEFDSILARLALCESHEQEADLGRSKLASLLFHARPALFDEVLRRARRDNRVRRCLSAARYYSGLSDEKCRKIDVVLQRPFPAAKRRR